MLCNKNISNIYEEDTEKYCLFTIFTFFKLFKLFYLK